MRVLVTGAAGFVGAHCIEALEVAGNCSVVAACRDAGKLPKSFNGTVKTGDLRDDDYLKEVMQDVDVVIHAAAWSCLWGNKTKSDELYLKPSLDVLNEAKRAGVKRFILISSTSVAAPEGADDPMCKGRERAYWPHEANLVRIENAVRESANENFCAINLRLGLFVGERYSLGLLPILVPRLKTHLVPWVGGGKTSMPLVDGRDIGLAASLCALEPSLKGYDAFNICGPQIPKVRDVLNYLHEKYKLPRPHFGVSFPVAFVFAGLMEALDKIVPWEPLVTRSIIHLMEETNLDNKKAYEVFDYEPKFHWKSSIDMQMAEMARVQKKPMSMVKPLPIRLK